MKRCELDLINNPSFNTVTGLTNTSFNPNNYVENRMATEEQISQLYNRIVEQEQRRDKCCRDIIMWESHVQVVRLNSNTITEYGIPSAGGVIIESFDDNINVGTTRRGMAHTVVFSKKWDDNLYFPVTPEMEYDSANCSSLIEGNTTYTTSVLVNQLTTIVQYRYCKNNSIIVSSCNNNINSRSGFILGVSYNMEPVPGDGRRQNLPIDNSLLARVGDNWGQFIFNIADDGTVTLRNNGRENDYNIIRYYTQWTLNRCADNTLLSDNTWPVQPRR